MPSVSPWSATSTAGTAARIRCDVRGASGVWELFVPGLEAGALYKFELRHRDTGLVLREERSVRARVRVAAVDGRARDGGQPPTAGATASGSRAGPPGTCQHAPINVYEVHAGSWLRHPDGRFYG